MATQAQHNSPLRRARALAVQAIRRSGLLPATMPDRISDPESVTGTTLHEPVLVYFADTRPSLYQIQQWYGPLRELALTHPVVVVCLDSRAARVIREESGLRVITVGTYTRLDALLAGGGVKLALYVNHSPQNFACLRFTSLAHVFLSHGDSDKGVAVSNQTKAYDLWFVPGQAGIDRAQSYIMFYDAAARCVPIGRPQLDFDRPDPADLARHDSATRRPVLLYAPTWEGAQPSLAYGSIASHGERLVGAIIDAGRFDVRYRPHPLSGSADPAYGNADAAIRTLVAEAGGGHRVDVTTPLNQAFAEADVLVCDVSAVANDWLPSGKPFVVTEPASAAVVTARTRMLDVVPRLAVSDLDGVADLVATQLDADESAAERAALIEYYVGDPTPGVSTRRFLEACSAVIARRDEAWSAVTANGPAGP
jgi:hypothetical protein